MPTPPSDVTAYASLLVIAAALLTALLVTIGQRDRARLDLRDAMRDLRHERALNVDLAKTAKQTRDAAIDQAVEHAREHQRQQQLLRRDARWCAQNGIPWPPPPEADLPRFLPLSALPPDPRDGGSTNPRLRRGVQP